MNRFKFLGGLVFLVLLAGCVEFQETKVVQPTKDLLGEDACNAPNRPSKGKCVRYALFLTEVNAEKKYAIGHIPIEVIKDNEKRNKACGVDVDYSDYDPTEHPFRIRVIERDWREVEENAYFWFQATGEGNWKAPLRIIKKFENRGELEKELAKVPKSC